LIADTEYYFDINILIGHYLKAYRFFTLLGCLLLLGNPGDKLKLASADTISQHLMGISIDPRLLYHFDVESEYCPSHHDVSLGDIGGDERMIICWLFTFNSFLRES